MGVGSSRSFCGGPTCHRHLIQGSALVEMAACDDGVEPLGVSDVLQRVAVEQEQVGDLAGINGSERFVQA
jgi:hypothetical protein